MEETLRQELERARRGAAAVRDLVDGARRAGAPAAEVRRRRSEVDRLEDVGRSAVLECLEAGEHRLALEAARGLADALADEAERAARALVLARQAGAVAP